MSEGEREREREEILLNHILSSMWPPPPFHLSTTTTHVNVKQNASYNFGLNKYNLKMVIWVVSFGTKLMVYSENRNLITLFKYVDIKW